MIVSFNLQKRTTETVSPIYLGQPVLVPWPPPRYFSLLRSLSFSLHASARCRLAESSCRTDMPTSTRAGKSSRCTPYSPQHGGAPDPRPSDRLLRHVGC